jgi:hypothetical protein
MPVASNAIVARGLVHRVCLHGLVTQRRSKLNYGVRTQHPYEGKIVHGSRSEAKPKRDFLDGVEYINTIDWFLPKVGTCSGRSRYRCADPSRIKLSSRARKL